MFEKSGELKRIREVVAFERAELDALEDHFAKVPRSGRLRVCCFPTGVIQQMQLL